MNFIEIVKSTINKKKRNCKNNYEFWFYSTSTILDFFLWLTRLMEVLVDICLIWFGPFYPLGLQLNDSSLSSIFYLCLLHLKLGHRTPREKENSLAQFILTNTMVQCISTSGFQYGTVSYCLKKKTYKLCLKLPPF